MLQRFKKTEAAASGSAMETENHLKNRAILAKNLMSRINFLFALLAMLFLPNINGLAQFSGGNGESGTPYLISSEEDMQSLATQVNNGTSFAGKYFLLTKDLTQSNKVTTVIGTASEKPFNGIFDGGEHEIEMSLNTSGTGGVFGHISNANIRNLTVGGSIKTTSDVGGICGYAKNSSISNCCNTGTIISTNSDRVGAGGICGWSDKSNISGCHNTGSITGSRHSGGICGYSTGNFSNCYNIGNVSTSLTTPFPETYPDIVRRSSGGICGFSTGNFSSCYNTGNISTSIITSPRFSIPEDSSGGICGYWLWGEPGSSLSNCYNTGSVSAFSDYGDISSGGICGRSMGGFIISNCYNTGSISVDSFSPARSGGICGTGSIIDNCFAANTKITTGDLKLAGRIVGDSSNSIDVFTITNCYALSSMLINDVPVYTQNTANEKNGQDMDIASFQSQTWITNNLGWDFTTVWKQRPNEFPILFHQDVVNGIGNVCANQLQIFPNPVKDELKVESGELKVEKVEIFDISGKSLLTVNFQFSTIDVSVLPKGVYLLKIFTDKRLVISKIVKE